jgi:hypothetical protein
MLSVLILVFKIKSDQSHLNCVVCACVHFSYPLIMLSCIIIIIIIDTCIALILVWALSALLSHTTGYATWVTLESRLHNIGAHDQSLPVSFSRASFSSHFIVHSYFKFFLPAFFHLSIQMHAGFCMFPQSCDMHRDCRIFIVRAWCSECVHTLDLSLSSHPKDVRVMSECSWRFLSLWIQIRWWQASNFDSNNACIISKLKLNIWPSLKSTYSLYLCLCVCTAQVVKKADFACVCVRGVMWIKHDNEQQTLFKIGYVKSIEISIRYDILQNWYDLHRTFSFQELTLDLWGQAPWGFNRGYEGAQYHQQCHMFSVFNLIKNNWWYFLWQGTLCA